MYNTFLRLLLLLFSTLLLSATSLKFVLSVGPTAPPYHLLLARVTIMIAKLHSIVQIKVLLHGHMMLLWFREVRQA